MLFFVVLTSAALLDAYAPDLRGSGKHHVAASLLGLVVFFALVSRPVQAQIEALRLFSCAC